MTWSGVGRYVWWPRLFALAVADRLSHVMGIKSADFQKCLLKPRVKAGRDWVTATVTAQKVRAHKSNPTVRERAHGRSN